MFKPIVWQLIELEPLKSVTVTLNSIWQFKATHTDSVTSEITEETSPGIVPGEVYRLVDSSGTAAWEKNPTVSLDDGMIALNQVSNPFWIDIYLDSKKFIKSYFETDYLDQMNFHEKGLLNFAIIDNSSTLSEKDTIPDSISNSCTEFSTSASDTIQITLEKDSLGTVETSVEYGN